LATRALDSLYRLLAEQGRSEEASSELERVLAELSDGISIDDVGKLRRMIAAVA
jgi:hypothetical protein